jgi:hypothetical protein
MSLAEALDRRRSVREFSEDRLSPGRSQLLWSQAHGGMGARLPSGAFYPLELYLRHPRSVHYLPETTTCARSRRGFRPAVSGPLSAGRSQGRRRGVPRRGRPERTSAKYGRGQRYVMPGRTRRAERLRALSRSTSRRFGRRLRRRAVRSALDLPNGEPLYLVAVGPGGAPSLARRMERDRVEPVRRCDPRACSRFSAGALRASASGLRLDSER